MASGTDLGLGVIPLAPDVTPWICDMENYPSKPFKPYFLCNSKGLTIENVFGSLVRESSGRTKIPIEYIILL